MGQNDSNNFVLPNLQTQSAFVDFLQRQSDQMNYEKGPVDMQTSNGANAG